MKSINLISLKQTFNSLENDIFKKFCQYFEIEISDSELNDLCNLISLFNYNENNKNLFNDFFIGYRIPQISKEFDLLRIGENYTINIELKRESTEEKIKKQLIKNKYYLSAVSCLVYNFAYISESNRIYQLVDNNLQLVTVDILTEKLKNQVNKKIENIDYLFNPSNYLVSPFNSTNKFLNKQYFLTNQQEEMKCKILERLNTNSGNHFTSITGSAGTGKTLLAYDIAKEAKISKRIIIIHCGNLNDGQNILNNHEWNIIPIKDLNNLNINDYDIIFIDEIQRIRIRQFNELIEKIKNSQCKCIFSFDKLQTLANMETKNNIAEKILSLTGIENFNLSEKIRTNKEIASFIRGIFNNKKNDKILESNNITFEYYTDVSDIIIAINNYKNNGWEVLQFTPTQYGINSHESYLNTDTLKSHEVIGQEFDNIVVIIDGYFIYGEHNNLFYTGRSYYNAEKMLFQNMTRTRKKLKIIILNNPLILNRCLTLLNK